MAMTYYYFHQDSYYMMTIRFQVLVTELYLNSIQVIVITWIAVIILMMIVDHLTQITQPQQIQQLKHHLQFLPIAMIIYILEVLVDS